MLGAFVIALSLSAASHAAHPGKPGRIAFSVQSSANDSSDIVTVNPDGSDRRVVAPSDYNIFPAWSPNGNAIAYTDLTGVAGSPDHTVYTVPAGGGPRTFVADGGSTKTLFTHDGTRLLLRNGPTAGTGALAVLMTPSGVPVEPRVVAYATQEAFVQAGPATSPDGRFFLDAFRSPTADDVFLLDLTGKLPARNLTNTPSVREGSPVFSPDGSAIAYERYGLDSSRDIVIEVLDLRTGQRTVVSVPGKTSSAPDWGPIPVSCAGLRATLVGTEFADVLVGTPGRDVIAGLGGDDTLIGKQADDVLCGGAGQDALRGNKHELKAKKGSRGKGKRKPKNKGDRCYGEDDRDTAKGCELRRSV
jgi:Ca2+-binding RTX toxin-like protein